MPGCSYMSIVTHQWHIFLSCMANGYVIVMCHFELISSFHNNLFMNSRDKLPLWYDLLTSLLPFSEILAHFALASSSGLAAYIYQCTRYPKYNIVVINERMSLLRFLAGGMGRFNGVGLCRLLLQSHEFIKHNFRNIPRV